MVGPSKLLKGPAVIGADNPVSSTSPKTIENQYRLSIGPARLRLELDDQQPLTLKGGVLERRGRLALHPAELHLTVLPLESARWQMADDKCPMANGR